MSRFASSLAVGLLLLAGCSSSSPADICLKNAYDDYKVTRSQHILDKISDRVVAKMEAKSTWANASKECMIRHGDPKNVDDVLKWATEVRDDQTW